jgi:AcrR family transcriptional regulator
MSSGNGRAIAVPKIVDHGERRRIIAEATWRVIERDGFDRATFRAIAKELGYTPSVVAHYFRDKERLMEFAFKLGCEDAFLRIERDAQHLPPGMPRLKIALEHMMPDSLGRDISAKATLNYWGAAASTPAMVAVHRQSYLAWRALLRRFLGEAAAAGQVASALDIDLESSSLIALIDGIMVGSALESSLYPRSVQRTLIHRALARLSTDYEAGKPRAAAASRKVKITARADKHA